MKQLECKTKYAIKTIDNFYNFIHEISIYKSLTHPNIAKLISYDMQKMKIYMHSYKYDLQKHDVHDKAKIKTQIYNSIAYLHSKNIIHADISPDNILLDEDENAYLCDFGLSTISGYVDFYVYKDPYKAPELFNNNEHVTYASDSWAYGCLLYYINNRNHLFKDKTHVLEFAKNKLILNEEKSYLQLNRNKRKLFCDNVIINRLVTNKVPVEYIKTAKKQIKNLRYLIHAQYLYTYFGQTYDDYFACILIAAEINDNYRKYANTNLRQIIQDNFNKIDLRDMYYSFVFEFNNDQLKPILYKHYSMYENKLRKLILNPN